MTTDPVELITAKEAMKIIGVQNPRTMYRFIKAGRFPKPVKIGPMSTRFVRSECHDYARKLIAERDAKAKGE